MSTLRVNTLQNTSTTDGGISIDNSGHVTVDGVAMPSSGPLRNRNLIINGAMQVAQRGTSSTASGYGTVDRFRSQPTSGTVTQSQESLTSGDPYDEGFRYFLRTTNTTAGSDDAAEQREIRQYIEAQNLASSGWNYTSSTSYCTLSFWARSSVGGTYYVLNRSIDGTGQGYTFSFALTADTWTKVTHAIPGNSNITVDNDNGVGFQVRVLTDLGTNYTDSGHTLDTWAAFNDSSRCPDFDHDWAGTTDATFDLTGVQLEVGSVATPFEHRSYGDELQRCMRYYEKSQPITYYYTFLIATSVYRGAFRFTVPKRAAPNVVVANANTGSTFSTLPTVFVTNIDAFDYGASSACSFRDYTADAEL